MNDKKISIIVIIYKVEAYLRECLLSIQKQDYKNIEVILVVGHSETGTDDGCSAICTEFAENDSRFKIVSCTARGAADARNKGLLAATGDYIGFVDGDDFIEPDMYSHLLELLTENNGQIAVCGRFYEYEDAVLKDEPYDKARVMSDEEAIAMVLEGNGFYLHCWDKLYTADLWKDIEFPVDKYVEDRIVVNRVLAKAERIIYDRIPKYHFRERSGSLSKTGSVARQNMEANRVLADFVYENYRSLKPVCDQYMIYEYITAIQNVYLAGSVDRAELKEYKDELRKFVKGCDTIPKKLFVKLELALYMPWLLAANTKRKNKIQSPKRYR